MLTQYKKVDRFLLSTSLSVAILLLLTNVAHAQDSPDSFKDLVGIIIDILQTAIPVLVGVALLIFFWGLVEYVWSAGSNEAVRSGRARMVWGIVGLFVIASLWGIVQVVANTFGF